MANRTSSKAPAAVRTCPSWQRLAGIDGVIVAWYGLTDFRDYPILHRNTTRLLETAERLKSKFVICYVMEGDWLHTKRDTEIGAPKVR